MSKADYTPFVKMEPVEEDAGMELKFPQTIKSEPYFQDIPESNPSFELKETEDVPTVKVAHLDEQNVEATSYTSETIVKEELIIEDCEGFVEMSNSELKDDTPNEADDVPATTIPGSEQEAKITEITPYSSETIVKEELIIDDSNASLLESPDEELEEEDESDSLKNSSKGKKNSSKGKKTWFCVECNKSFHRRQSYSSHRLRHSVIKSGKYSCNYCERPFSSKCDLERHVKALHTSGSARSKEEKRTWQCHLCPTLCNSIDAYRSHLSTHKQQVLSMFRCEYCSICFGDQESVTNHVETGQCSKLPKQIVQEENGLFKCCECNQAFTLRRSCVQHTKRHFALRNKTFQCVTCGSLHGTHRELAKHARTHGEILPLLKKRKPSIDPKAGKPNIYRCSECPKTFLERSGCDRHIKRHESLRNGTFQCDECDKRYGRHSELRKHKLFHEKQRAKAAAK